MSWSVGIDVGGTFTDLAAVGPDGALRTGKVLSTPADQGAGVADALARFGVPGAEIARIAHGTTVVTNLLLERSGARVVACLTEGATDLLELRRQERAALYDLTAHHPAPLVDHTRVVAVRERMNGDQVRVALTREECERVADAVAALEPEIVLVALLHSYASDAHERLLAESLRRRLRHVEVVRSGDVLPEIREYERTATAAAEAYARPRVMHYLGMLERRLASTGHPAPMVMTSGGGMRTTHDAARGAASLALSGPAGGVVGAAAVLRAAGFTQALTIDIGGTSADAGLIQQGEPLVEPGGEVAGIPIALPRVLVETVSAGGGSILWIDDGGALRVGPRSAGANPGPAAFARGGTAPTLTDAHVLLGHLDATHLSGGVTLDPAAAQAAIAPLAATLGVAPAAVAVAALAIADAAMARALRRVSVDRGVDPRDAVLVAFGGAGPLHGTALADLLEMRTVLIPPHAGVLSAVGLAMAPERREAASSVMLRADAFTEPRCTSLCQALAARAEGEDRRYVARVRYEGQGHELDIPVRDGDDGHAIAARFTSLHQLRTGFTLDRAVEIVAMRLAASGPQRAATFARSAAPTFDAARRIDEGGPCDAVLDGPTTIILSDATVRISAGWRARALAVGGWLVERV
ncbi:MAG: hydantoinase/oxoprolinase family protein [Gemmatimonadaceae bacterium]|nr:hydantoinase/oxoprolinase family protein [Gemmatimonadaceae bacterium]